MTRMRESITTDDLIETEERYRPETGGRQSLRTDRRLMEEELDRPQHKKRSTRKSKNKKNR